MSCYSWPTTSAGWTSTPWRGVKERCAELGLRYREPQVGDFLLAVTDAVIAAQNAVIAAESLGIGSCYIGDVTENYEDNRQLFSLPALCFPCGPCFALGVPGASTPPKPRSHASRRNSSPTRTPITRLDAGELECMLQPREDKFPDGRYLEGAQNFGQHEYFRKFNADFSFEMSRSVREALKNWDCE